MTNKISIKIKDTHTHTLTHTHTHSLQSALEALQQSSARTGATVQSLRQQLAEVEQKQASGATRSEDLTQLQEEVGRLKNEMKKKVGILINLRIH